MSYDLSALTRIAQGGQADIYALDGGRILRVLRSSDAVQAEMLHREYAVMAALRELGVSVPRVFECCQVDGHPALAMQRIDGPSLLRRLQRNPLRIGAVADSLAQLHCAVLASPAIDGLPDIKTRARRLVPQSRHLDAADVAFVNELLDELPEGRALLHGDYHPGNILSQGDDLYIIDWFNATTGDAVSDVAHSYLLLCDKPHIQGESMLEHRFLRTTAVWFGGLYLSRMHTRLGFDMDVFGKWMAVRAAERSAYGQPSELMTKARFVRRCRQARADGVPAAQWPRLLARS